MASREELNNQKQVNKELKSELTTRQEIVDQVRNLTDSSRELLGLSTKRSQKQREMNSLLNSANSALSKQLKDFTSLNDVQSTIATNTENVARMRAEATIAVRGMTKPLNTIAKLEEQIAKKEKEQETATGEQAKRLQEQIAKLSHRIDRQKESFTEEQLLGAELLETANAIEYQNQVLASQEQGFKNLNKAGGVFEGTLQSISGVLNKAGLGDLAKKMGFDEIDAQMEEFKKDLLAVEDEFGEITYRSAEVGETLQMNIKRAGLMAGALREAIPTLILGKMVQTLTEVSNQQREQRKLTGQSATNIGAMNMSMVSSIDMLKTINALSSELGINVDAAFSKATLLEAAELTELMGMSAESAAKLSIRAEANGQSLKKHTQESFKTTKNFIQQNKSAVNVGQVMDDVANASGGVAMSLGNSTEALTKAAAQARSMGLSLKEMEGIADGLLSIESSLEAEMEAELLTGKSLNLERARSAALMNDMETLGKEIAGNQEILNAFQSGNRLEQQAIAKSLGMSTDQVANMIHQQKISAGMSEEQARKASGISEEEAKRLSVQESLNKSMEKFAAALAPITSFLATIVSNKAVLIGVFSAIALTYIPKIINGFGAVKTGLATLTKSMGGLGKVSDVVFGKMYKGGQFMPGGARAAAGGERGISLLGRMGKALKSSSIATYAQAAATKVLNAAIFAKNLVVGAAVRLMNSNLVVKTRDYLADKAKAAQTLLLNGYLAAKNLIMNTTLGRYIALGAAKLVDTARTLAGIGATVGQTTANTALAASQTALATTGAAAGGGMAAAGAGLGAFGAAAAPAIPVILAIGAALLMASPAIYAFSFVIKALGEVIIGVLSMVPPIITAIAEGFVMIMGAVTPQNVLAMAALGPALVLASIGLVAFGAAMAGASFAAFFGGGILKDLEEFAVLGPKIALLGAGLSQTTEFMNKMGGFSAPLFSVSAAIRSIATSLSLMSVAGLMAMPIIGTLIALSKAGAGLAIVSKLIGSVVGGDEEDEKNKELQQVIDEMKDMKIILKQLLAKDTAVYIDGERIDEAIQVGSKLD